MCVKTVNSLRKARKITRKHQTKVMSVPLRNDMLVSKILMCVGNFCALLIIDIDVDERMV